jgi:hypothetical protein
VTTPTLAANMITKGSSHLFSSSVIIIVFDYHMPTFMCSPNRSYVFFPYEPNFLMGCRDWQDQVGDMPLISTTYSKLSLLLYPRIPSCANVMSCAFHHIPALFVPKSFLNNHQGYLFFLQFICLYHMVPSKFPTHQPLP